MRRKKIKFIRWWWHTKSDAYWCWQRGTREKTSFHLVWVVGEDKILLICFLTFPTVENASGLSSRSVRTHNILFCYEPFWLDFKGLFASFLKEIQWTVMAKANAKARKKNWKKNFIEFSIFPRKTEKLQFVSFFFSLVFFRDSKHTPAYVLLKQMATKGTTLYSWKTTGFSLFFSNYSVRLPLSTAASDRNPHIIHQLHDSTVHKRGPDTR